MFLITSSSFSSSLDGIVIALLCAPQKQHPFVGKQRSFKQICVNTGAVASERNRERI
eukprot:m.18835 g.18835  ORF g.18835 m.18835 type:complete len:57 (+) comp12107_c0_seq1:60-230(+)